MENQQKQRWTGDYVTTALYRNEFIPLFQPKINIATGISSCIEILARWDHPEFGILPPSPFIGQIEKAGLIDRFTDNLFRQSLVGTSNNHY
jgi:predicted signal transduction protein with EAL and GGDEF domain